MIKIPVIYVRVYYTNIRSIIFHQIIIITISISTSIKLYITINHQWPYTYNFDTSCFYCFRFLVPHYEHNGQDQYSYSCPVLDVNDMQHVTSKGNTFIYGNVMPITSKGNTFIHVFYQRPLYALTKCLYLSMIRSFI